MKQQDEWIWIHCSQRRSKLQISKLIWPWDNASMRYSLSLAIHRNAATPRGEDNGGSGGDFTPRPPLPPPIHGIECTAAAAAAGLLRGKASTTSGRDGHAVNMKSIEHGWIPSLWIPPCTVPCREARGKKVARFRGHPRTTLSRPLPFRRPLSSKFEFKEPFRPPPQLVTSGASLCMARHIFISF